MKKLLGIILSAVMIFAMIPVTGASAMENGSYYNQWNYDEVDSSFYLAKGAVYYLPYYSNLWEYMGSDYEYNEETEEYESVQGSYRVETLSGPEGNVISIDGEEIKGLNPGKVRVYFYDYDGNILKDSTMDHDYITITVRNVTVSKTSQTVYVPYDEYGWYDKQVSVKVNQDITKAASQVYAEDYGIEKIDFSKDRIYFRLYEKGTTTYRVNIEGKFFNFKFKLVPVKLNKSYLMAYKGKSSDTLKIASPKSMKGITYESTNKKVATVGKTSGKVKYKGIGRCYIKAKKNGVTMSKCLVEVTYKKQYKAVKNAYKDLKANLKYSQAKRMSKGYRDCSSFTSRCYYDAGKGRKLMTIGPSSAKNWALTAAGQAKWLNSHGKRVSYKHTSVKNLLPGDLIFFRTGYAGKNKEYRSIDHAAIYVGNGLMMDTVSSLGLGKGTGTIDLRYYDYDTRVVFVGRPCK